MNLGTITSLMAQLVLSIERPIFDQRRRVAVVKALSANGT